MMAAEDRETDGSIEARAAAWVVRLGGVPLDAEERRRLDLWLAADPAHQAAFNHADALWQRLGQTADMPVAPMPMRFARRKGSPLRRMTGLAAAACLVAAVGLGMLGIDPRLMIAADHVNGPAGVAEITLPDGSVAILDASSAIAVEFGSGERRIDLLAGRAWFRVAAAADTGGRPFVVTAGRGHVRALGTAFIVSREAEDRTGVAVTEHSVRVETGPETAVTIGTGQAVTYDGTGHIGAVAAIDPARATAWRDGRLIFDRQPLAQVAAVLERHGRGHVLILDEALAARPVSGVFRADDPAGALAAIARELGARIDILPLLTVIRPGG
ncbi:FecR domain-containing protein [Tistrella mobilis]|uniref:FecR family protein n=1 Tax=Tistrella mobilis TaxID=171437 RepID=UPI003557FD63